MGEISKFDSNSECGDSRIPANPGHEKPRRGFPTPTTVRFLTTGEKGMI